MEAGKGKSKREENSEDAFAVRLLKRINVARYFRVVDIHATRIYTGQECTRLNQFFYFGYRRYNTRPFLALSVLNTGATLCNKVHCAL